MIPFNEQQKNQELGKWKLEEQKPTGERIYIKEENKMEEEQVTNETESKNWIKEEKEKLEANKFDGESLPALKLEEGKITEFEVDFSKPFDKWEAEDGTIKKIIPVKHEGQSKVLWINTRNPTYREIIEAGDAGQTLFKILRTGQQKATRYTLVKD